MNFHSFRDKLRSFSRLDSRGIVLGVVGEKYLPEAAEAARAVKKHMRIDVDITTDAAGYDFLLNMEDNPFDRIDKVENAYGMKITSETNRLVKMHSILESRFDKTLFIDSDINILNPIWDVFSALDRWDFLACHAPVRYGALHQNFTETFTGSKKILLKAESELRYIFPEVNGGFLALSRSRRSRKVIRRWKDHYIEQFNYYRSQNVEPPLDTDQATLRRAIIDVMPNICIMPPEFNIRVIMPYFVGGNAQARILHGRGPGLENALSSINSSTAVRVGKPDTGLIE